METKLVHRHWALPKRRRSIAVLGLSGFLALAACGADAEPASRPARAAPQSDAAAAPDVPVSPDQIERRTGSQTQSQTPWWADPARHPANQDPALSKLWWAQKR
jgi:hypothetical protein